MINISYLFQTFRYILLYAFGVGLLMRVFITWNDCLAYSIIFSLTYLWCFIIWNLRASYLFTLGMCHCCWSLVPRVLLSLYRYFCCWLPLKCNTVPVGPLNCLLLDTTPLCIGVLSFRLDICHFFHICINNYYCMNMIRTIIFNCIIKRGVNRRCKRAY